MAAVSVEPEKARPEGGFPWVDATLVAIITVSAAWIFARIDLTESVFESTRPWEHLQLDELPATLLVLAAGLIWIAWRRHSQAVAELGRRQAAEVQLSALLLDQRRLAQQHVQAQESERKALARELHDELGQYLNAIKTDAVSIQSKSGGETSIGRAASAIIAHCDHLQEVIRGLMSQLRPVGLDVLGLRSALEHFLEHTQQRTLQRSLDASLSGDLDSLDEEISLAVYRLIQEGLTNVSRHAHAQRVQLKVSRTADEEIHVSLVDDGRGADPSIKTPGLGLIGMRERVEMLAGELHVETAPNEGFSIFARLPVRKRLAVEG